MRSEVRSPRAKEPTPDIFNMPTREGALIVEREATASARSEMISTEHN